MIGLALQPNLVRQKHKQGCSIAVLSMITGKPYDEIGKELREYYWDRDGLRAREYDRWLAENGYAVCRIFEARIDGSKQPWPPAPFADLHICSVWPEKVGGSTHCVLMLRNGTVLDPDVDEPKRLNDYAGVHSVAGVYQV